jgi:hypothetical protein
MCCKWIIYIPSFSICNLVIFSIEGVFLRLLSHLAFFISIVFACRAELLGCALLDFVFLTEIINAPIILIFRIGWGSTILLISWRMRWLLCALRGGGREYVMDHITQVKLLQEFNIETIDFLLGRGRHDSGWRRVTLLELDYGCRFFRLGWFLKCWGRGQTLIDVTR